MFRKFLPLVAALSLAIPGAAFAHVKLSGSTPAANATVSKPVRIELKFSEKLIAPTIKTEVIMLVLISFPNLRFFGYESQQGNRPSNNLVVVWI